MSRPALRAALRAEYAVVYGYGIVGARLAGADRQLAADRLAAHQRLRDELLALAASDPQRPAPAVGYRLPFPVIDVESARRLAIHLEDAAAGAAWDLVATSRPATAVRGIGVSALGDAATAAARWRGRAGATDDPALPGAPPTRAGHQLSQPSTIPTTSAS